MYNSVIKTPDATSFQMTHLRVFHSARSRPALSNASVTGSFLFPLDRRVLYVVEYKGLKYETTNLNDVDISTGDC
jgi:hypothetical protein